LLTSHYITHCTRVSLALALFLSSPLGVYECECVGSGDAVSTD